MRSDDSLQRWARRAKSSQALAQRCRIVLGCAAGKSNKEVAAEEGVWPQTVCKWRKATVPGQSVETDWPTNRVPVRREMIGDEQIEQVVVATLERRTRRRHALVTGHRWPEEE